jgi:exodeoxyribonuclease III
MKIASWNVNSLNVRLPHLTQWLADAQPDIVALQETKLEDAKFPTEAINALGYSVVFSGQKTYNGVAILARGELSDVVTDIPGLDDPQRRILAATVGAAPISTTTDGKPGTPGPGQAIRVVNLYVVNGQEVGSEKYAYKLNWLARVREFLAAEAQRHPNLVVLGDFNIVPDDRDVYDPVGLKDTILLSTPERDALRGMLALGLHDTFRLFSEDAGQYSWWDYRMGAFRRNLGMRIDLILASEALRARCTGASIDREPRRWERASDHAPVLLELRDV